MIELIKKSIARKLNVKMYGSYEIIKFILLKIIFRSVLPLIIAANVKLLGMKIAPNLNECFIIGF